MRTITLDVVGCVGCAQRLAAIMACMCCSFIAIHHGARHLALDHLVRVHGVDHPPIGWETGKSVGWTLYGESALVASNGVVGFVDDATIGADGVRASNLDWLLAGMVTRCG